MVDGGTEALVTGHSFQGSWRAADQKGLFKTLGIYVCVRTSCSLWGLLEDIRSQSYLIWS